MLKPIKIRILFFTITIGWDQIARALLSAGSPPFDSLRSRFAAHDTLTPDKAIQDVRKWASGWKDFQ